MSKHSPAVRIFHHQIIAGRINSGNETSQGEIRSPRHRDRFGKRKP